MDAPLSLSPATSPASPPRRPGPPRPRVTQGPRQPCPAQELLQSPAGHSGSSLVETEQVPPGGKILCSATDMGPRQHREKAGRVLQPGGTRLGTHRLAALWPPPQGSWELSDSREGDAQHLLVIYRPLPMLRNRMAPGRQLCQCGSEESSDLCPGGAGPAAESTLCPAPRYGETRLFPGSTGHRRDTGLRLQLQPQARSSLPFQRLEFGTGNSRERAVSSGRGVTAQPVPLLTGAATAPRQPCEVGSGLSTGKAAPVAGRVCGAWRDLQGHCGWLNRGCRRGQGEGWGSPCPRAQGALAPKVHPRVPCQQGSHGHRHPPAARGLLVPRCRGCAAAPEPGAAAPVPQTGRLLGLMVLLFGAASSHLVAKESLCHPAAC